MRTSIAILSGHSLLAEGVASRLRQYLQHVELEIVNPREPDAMAQIIAAQPSIVILDVADAEATRLCSLSELLLLLPTLKVIRLDPRREEIQVVTSEQLSAFDVRDLVEVIKRAT